MQPPFVLHIPPVFSEGIKLVYAYPSGYNHVISYAKPAHLICELGELISQSIAGDSYWIEFWEFDIRIVGYIDIEIMRSFTAVTLFLEGVFESYVPGIGRILYPPKTYNMFYMRGKTQRIFLKPSRYSLLFFIPPDFYLDGLPGGVPPTESNDKLLPAQRLPIAVLRMLKRMQYSTKRGIELDLDLRKHMFEVTAQFVRQLENEGDFPAGLQGTMQIATAVKHYVLHNMSDANMGGVQQLALLFHISVKQLTKEFKTVTGKTIPQFIRDERLALARTLLLNKNIQVSEAASQSGFTDTPNFIRQFKRKYGYSPGTLKGKSAN